PVKSSCARVPTSMRYRMLSWSSSPVPFLHDRSLGRRKIVTRIKMSRPPTRKELSVALDVQGSGSWLKRGGITANVSRRKNLRYRARSPLLIRTWFVSRIPKIMRSFVASIQLVQAPPVNVLLVRRLLSFVEQIRPNNQIVHLSSHKA